MKVLVTGSNGLVGTALKEILGDGHIYHTKKDVDLTDEVKTMPDAPLTETSGFGHSFDVTLSTISGHFD